MAEFAASSRGAQASRQYRGPIITSSTWEKVGDDIDNKVEEGMNPMAAAAGCLENDSVRQCARKIRSLRGVMKEYTEARQMLECEEGEEAESCIVRYFNRELECSDENKSLEQCVRERMGLDAPAAGPVESQAQDEIVNAAAEEVDEEEAEMATAPATAPAADPATDPAAEPAAASQRVRKFKKRRKDSRARRRRKY
jgi:hypothetical protein